MKLIDSFLFNNELDLLEVRLRLLYDHVDHFVIFEADTTHMGKPKPLYLEQNRTRFAAWMDKIVHVVYRGDAKLEQYGDFAWENAQRQLLYEKASSLADEGDIIIMSDLDEMPSREMLDGLRVEKPKRPFILLQDLYYYNLKSPRKWKWRGTIVIPFTGSHKKIASYRDTRSVMHGREDGWHFSYFMSVDDMVVKLQSFAHGEQYGVPPFTDKDRIRKAMEENYNFLGKKDGTDYPRPLPEYVAQEMLRFPYMVGA
jgi:beta-1,4-mannosyl-glycoprotein beta-1,4-N-acetylglucosaminyltransferase